MSRCVKNHTIKFQSRETYTTRDCEEGWATEPSHCADGKSASLSCKPFSSELHFQKDPCVSITISWTRISFCNFFWPSQKTESNHNVLRGKNKLSRGHGTGKRTSEKKYLSHDHTHCVRIKMNWSKTTWRESKHRTTVFRKNWSSFNIWCDFV